MRHLFAASLALVAASVLAAGCGSEPASRTPAATAAAAPPGDGGTYSSPRDIVAKLEAAGGQCPAYEVIANPAGALERAACGDDMTVGIYASEGDVEAQIEVLRTIGRELDSGPDVVAGRNWTVHTTDRQQLDLAWKTLGGRVVLE